MPTLEAHGSRPGAWSTGPPDHRGSTLWPRGTRRQRMSLVPLRDGLMSEGDFQPTVTTFNALIYAYGLAGVGM